MYLHILNIESMKPTKKIFLRILGGEGATAPLKWRHCTISRDYIYAIKGSQ